MGGGMVGKQPSYVNNEGGSCRQAICEVEAAPKYKMATIPPALTFREVGFMQGANERTAA